MLGYERYGAQGGDWGAIVAAKLGAADPERVAGIHLNYVIAPPPPDAGPEHADAIEQVPPLAHARGRVPQLQGTKPDSLTVGAVRLARRPGRLDRREVPHLERLRRRRRARYFKRDSC